MSVTGPRPPSTVALFHSLAVSICTKFVHEVDGDFDPDEFDGVDNLDDRDSGYDEDDFDEEEEVVPTRKKRKHLPLTTRTMKILQMRSGRLMIAICQ